MHLNKIQVEFKFFGSIFIRYIGPYEILSNLIIAFYRNWKQSHLNFTGNNPLPVLINN